MLTLPPLARRTVENLALVAVYWLVSHLIWAGFREYGMLPAPVWPAAGVALTAALWRGPAVLPGLYVGAVLANALSLGATWPVALGLSVINAAAPVAMAALIRRCSRQLPPFHTLPDVFRFLSWGVVVHAALTATGGLLVLWLGGVVAARQVPLDWLRWWTAHAVGTVLLAPVLLLWREPGGWRHWERPWELLFTTTVLIGATATVFFGVRGESHALVGLPALLILPVAWVAVRFPPRDVATLLPLMVAVATLGTLSGLGPYHLAGSMTPLVALGLLVVALSLTALVLGAMASERRTQEASLRLSASVFDSTLEGILITDHDGVILSVNPSFTEITGYTVEEAVGKTPRILRSHHHGQEFYRELWRALYEDGRWEGEIWNRRKDGVVFIAHESISAVSEDDGLPRRFVSVFNDVTHLRRQEERIRYMAYHDALTGLPNRLLLTDRLEQTVSRARRQAERFAVVFLDLDRFKVVNDSLGHEMGDRLLLEVARRLQDVIRQNDTVARLGGDEFVILMDPLGEPNAAATVAERVLASLARPIPLGGHSMHITPSLGISLFPSDGGSASELLKNADTAMYAAKNAGRNAYRYFDSSMNSAAVERLGLEGELRRAMDEGQLELFYQPKVRLTDGALSGAEALMRWRHPEKGMISPGTFIPLAEETGLIVPMGRLALELACRQMHDWHQQGLPWVPVAVNISARQLQDPSLAQDILGLLNHWGIPTGYLQLELTESALMEDAQAVAAVLTRLGEHGIRVAVDDFGTGYSSLSYLRHLPLAVVKVDRSFVIHVESNDSDAAIVRTIIAMTSTLGMDCVAEGVETEGQAAFLRQAGCGIAQGFLYSRPLPGDAFAAWVREQGAAAPVTCPVTCPVT